MEKVAQEEENRNPLDLICHLHNGVSERIAFDVFKRDTILGMIDQPSEIYCVYGNFRTSFLISYILRTTMDYLHT